MNDADHNSNHLQTPPSETAVLVYEPRGKRRLRRRVLRGACLVVLCVALPILILRTWRPVTHHIRVYGMVRACMNAPSDPETVVTGYSFSGIAADSHEIAGRKRAEVLAPLQQELKITPPNAFFIGFNPMPSQPVLIGARIPLFLHRLTPPSGAERLVIVERLEWEQFHATVIDPGSIVRSPSVVSKTYVRCDRALRTFLDCASYYRPYPNEGMFAAQPDAHDLARFTFKYELWGQVATVEGRIDNDNSIRLHLLEPDDFVNRLNQVKKNNFRRYLPRIPSGDGREPIASESAAVIAIIPSPRHNKSMASPSIRLAPAADLPAI
ncbi:MAG TPA: hypothetical protein VFE47_10600, partial [Tepidisphaeraceae bacterium]|nr:hypothetical protein [Tepidisphaeraceae bacterium]